VDELSLLDRREIEARIVGPIVAELRAEIGDDRALALIGRVIEGLAQQAGADLARELGEATLPAFATALDRWSQGGALEIELLRTDDDHLDFNVTRCRYAELYRRLGLADLGATLSCLRDGSLIAGFNPDLELVRTQTIMQGAPFCDFRFRRRNESPVEKSDPFPPG